MLSDAEKAKAYNEIEKILNDIGLISKRRGSDLTAVERLRLLVNSDTVYDTVSRINNVNSQDVFSYSDTLSDKKSVNFDGKTITWDTYTDSAAFNDDPAVGDFACVRETVWFQDAIWEAVMSDNELVEIVDIEEVHDKYAGGFVCQYTVSFNGHVTTFWHHQLMFMPKKESAK